MTDSEIVDTHIDPYDYANDIRVNLWLLCDVPFASRYFTKSGSIHIILSHAHAHYTITLWKDRYGWLEGGWIGN